MLHLDQLRLSQDGFSLSADLTVVPGAHVAIIGPSGAGKSTLLSAIAGFIAPASGRILWQGVDMTSLPPGQRPIAMLFQDNNLFPHLSVAQNVGLGLRPDLRLTADQQARVAQALDKVGLGNLGDRRPATLSGGQQSRVALARVAVQDRPLILLDEPFSALGPALRTEMLDLIRDIAKAAQATLLVVTHDPAEALRLKGQTILVAEGRAERPSDTEELLANPPPALADYLGP